MNPLLKKEIRLIFPAWGLTLLLLASALMFGHSSTPFDFMAPVWFGILVLCASSFGREFSLGTFSAMLAQPIPRKRYWIVKVAVLAAALVSALVICFLGVFVFHVVFVEDQGPNAATCLLLLLSALAGGLWLALLIRQLVAVVWLIVLVPVFLSVPVLLTMSHFNAADHTVETTLDLLLLIYSVAGIGGSWLIFRRAQDAPWSGGTIALPEWMSAGISLESPRRRLRQPPLRALIRKEFQFNQVPLLGMGVLLLVHLGVVGLRYWHRQPAAEDTFWRDTDSALAAFGFLWLIVPLVIGCTSIAEERKLGTMEGQLCQPVAARRQFLVKFGFTLIIGGLLSAALLFLAEGIGMAIGAAPYHHATELALALPHAGPIAVQATVAMLAIGIIGLFASSLTRNLLQALPAAVATVVGMGLVMGVFKRLEMLGGFSVWNPVLPDAIAVASLTFVLPWLAYRNFRCLHESAAIWRRNGLALATIFVLSAAASVLIYHRVWEKLTPFEPPHGPARWTLREPPLAIHSDLDDNLQISLPDGRIWFGFLHDGGSDASPEAAEGFWSGLFTSPSNPSLQFHQFMSGSNWLSFAAGYADVWAEQEVGGVTTLELKHYVNGRDTVGIRSDGTLWVSAKPSGTAWNTNPLVQFGTAADWQEVMGERSVSSVLLLKTNGTLWRWGERHGAEPPAGWAGLRACTPRQIGTNDDWARLLPVEPSAGQKRDRSVWSIGFDWKTRQDVVTPDTNFDLTGFKGRPLDGHKLAGWSSDNIVAYVHPDGTLWFLGHLNWDDAHHNSVQSLQCGAGTNWVGVALGESRLVALQSDGSLWAWDRRCFYPGGGCYLRDFAATCAIAPVRLGLHQDWVALAQTRWGPVSLAADGSLWLWGYHGYTGGSWNLLLPSGKPIPLGNILAVN